MQKCSKYHSLHRYLYTENCQPEQTLDHGWKQEKLKVLQNEEQTGMHKLLKEMQYFRKGYLLFELIFLLFIVWQSSDLHLYLKSQ